MLRFPRARAFGSRFGKRTLSGSRTRTVDLNRLSLDVATDQDQRPRTGPANGIQRGGVAVGVDFAVGEHRSVAIVNQIVGLNRILASFDSHLCDAAPRAGNPAEARVGSVGED
jgi:hypothetical protein